MSDLPTLHTLTTAPTPPAAGTYAQAAAAWRSQRTAAQAALVRTLSPDQQAALTALLTAHKHEYALTGAEQRSAAARREARSTNAAQNAALAEAAAKRKEDNRRTYELLQQAGADNAALRARAHAAETALATLRASLPAVERVVRQKIIAAAPADYRPLARLAPRSAVNHRYLSHGFHIRRIARRIEEFIAGPDCRGSATPEQVAEFLLPETPAPAFNHAITHLLLSGRLHQSPSGTYRLRNPTGAPR